MSTDVFPETLGHAETRSHAQSRGSRHSSSPQGSPRGRWWKGGLLTIPYVEETGTNLIVRVDDEDIVRLRVTKKALQ